jgi:hypothetical protein
VNEILFFSSNEGKLNEISHKINFVEGKMVKGRDGENKIEEICHIN